MAGRGAILGRLFLSCLYVFSLVSVCAGGLQCLSNNGAKVDWYVAYKIPYSLEKKLSFYYMDSQSTSWVKSTATLDNKKQAIAFTLQQIYNTHNQNTTSGGSDILYGMYNDEVPGGTKGDNFTASSYGHTKGVIAFDKSSGFWLVQSTPNFPPPRSKGYSWPNSAQTYGQSFLCISMDTNSNINELGKQLVFNAPNFYDKNIPAFAQKYPDIMSALNRKRVESPPWQRETKLRSLAGVTFTSFAKSKNFNADLYSVWLAPRFGSDLLVETWQNGVKKLCSNCSGSYKVSNVQLLNLNGSKFKETQDHSKWAVTTSSSNPWTCIGDINRQHSQLIRPGGTVCFQNPTVWKQYRNIVSAIHDCHPYDNCVNG